MRKTASRLSLKWRKQLKVKNQRQDTCTRGRRPNSYRTPRSRLAMSSKIACRVPSSKPSRSTDIQHKQLALVQDYLLVDVERGVYHIPHNDKLICLHEVTFLTRFHGAFVYQHPTSFSRCSYHILILILMLLADQALSCCSMCSTGCLNRNWTDSFVYIIVAK